MFDQKFKFLIKNTYFGALSLKSEGVMAHFTFLLLRPCTKWRGHKNKNNVVPSIFMKF